MKLIDTKGKELGAWGNLGLNGVRFVPMLGMFTFAPKVAKHWDEVKGAMKLLVMKNEAFAKVIKALSKGWEKIQGYGNGIVAKLGKATAKEVGEVANAMPKNGMYARVLNEKAAQEFLSGETKFARSGEEAFFTAADDIAHVKTPEGMAERLTLKQYADRPELRSDANTVIVFKRTKTDGVGSPIDPNIGTDKARNWGFKGQGTTTGGAREWVMENGTIQDMKAKGFEIDHIYSVDAQGGKTTWKIAANQNGTYMVKSTLTNETKENLKNLSSSSKGISSLDGQVNTSTNAPNAAKSGSNMLKQPAGTVESGTSIKSSPVTKPSSDSPSLGTKSDLDVRRGTAPVPKESAERSLVKTAAVGLVAGSAVAGTAQLEGRS